MSRAPAKITQADIVRAIKAAERMGKACEVEIRRDGSTLIRFVPKSPEVTDEGVAPAVEIVL